MNNYFLVATLLVTAVALNAGSGCCSSMNKSTCATTAACASEEECQKNKSACMTDACDTKKEEVTEEEAE